MPYVTNASIDHEIEMKDQPASRLTPPGPTEGTPSKRATVSVPIGDRADVPQVEVLKDDSIVRSIRISCPCGHSVDIRCQYAE